MGVAGIPCNEDIRGAGGSIVGIIIGVVEFVAQALPDFIDRPPCDFLYVQCIGMKNAPGGGNELFGGDVPV